MSKPTLKICGLTRQEDVDFCLAQHVEWVGFNFCPSSKRYLHSLKAAAIWRNSRIKHPDSRSKAVAVVCDMTGDELDVLLSEFPEISVVQLHAEETTEDRKRIRSQLGTRGLWQAIPVASRQDVEEGVRLDEQVDLVLFDAKPTNGGPLGGTGKVFDWALLANISISFALAGGIRSANLLAARGTNPTILDLCSGVETAAGVKSARLMREVLDVLAR